MLDTKTEPKQQQRGSATSVKLSVTGVDKQNQCVEGTELVAGSLDKMLLAPDKTRLPVEFRESARLIGPYLANNVHLGTKSVEFCLNREGTHSRVLRYAERGDQLVLTKEPQSPLIQFTRIPK